MYSITILCLDVYFILLWDILLIIGQLSRLHMILKPFMLRRCKVDVENEMAKKVTACYDVFMV